MKKYIVTVALLLLCIVPVVIAAGPATATDSVANELVTSFASQAVLNISEMWSYHPRWNCLGACLELQNDVAIGYMQVDVLYDTTCFDAKGIGKTRRTEVFDIFSWSKIPGGIRVVFTGLGHRLDPGDGPVVTI